MNAMVVDGRLILVQPDPVAQIVSVVIRGTESAVIRFELNAQEVTVIANACAVAMDPAKKDVDSEQLVRFTAYGVQAMADMLAEREVFGR